MDGDGLALTLERLDSQTWWYERSARSNQILYKGFKVVSVVASGAIPVLTAAAAPTIVAATLGSLVLAVEGIQQIFAFHQQWLAHRFTAEALKRERYLFGAHASPYSGTDLPEVLLAERIEALVADDTAAWRDLEATRTAANAAAGRNERTESKAE